MLYVLFNPHTLLLYIVCALCGFNMWLFYYPQEIKRKKKPLTRDKISCGKKKYSSQQQINHYILNPYGMPSPSSSLLITPQLPSSTIETITNAIKLYGNNLPTGKLIVFTYIPFLKPPTTTTSPSLSDSAISISSEDLQIIGSCELSTCQPLSMEFCNALKLSILAALDETQLGDNTTNKVVYFKDNENQQMIGHFLNQFLIVYT